MHLGFGELKLSSAQFWSMTPRELFAALSTPAGTPGDPLRRNDLTRTMTAFPDTKDTTNGPADGNLDR